MPMKMFIWGKIMLLESVVGNKVLSDLQLTKV